MSAAFLIAFTLHDEALSRTPNQAPLSLQFFRENTGTGQEHPQIPFFARADSVGIPPRLLVAHRTDRRSLTYPPTQYPLLDPPFLAFNMLPTIVQHSPLAVAIANACQPKVVEMGWEVDGNQESALIDYIVLMLINGKSREQLANELSNDFLGLDEGDTQALEFSNWLFDQVQILNEQINGPSAGSNGGQTGQENASAPALNPGATGFQMPGGDAGGDAEMGDAGDSMLVEPPRWSLEPTTHSIPSYIFSPPSGPKAMRNDRGGRGGRGRMFNQINQHMNRGDSALHRVQGQQGAGRIGGNGRGGMRGNRNNMARGGRNMSGHMGMQGNMMSPENQYQLMQMMADHAQMMSQMMPGFVPPPAINPSFQNPGQQGRPPFDRAQRGRGGKRGQNQRNRGGEGGDVDMDTTMGGGEQGENEGVCRFNLRCTRADCELAHQSPAAPPGTSIDITDNCSFGAACKNRKCTGRHPSPAVKSAHQAEEMCRFFPHCTNPHCHFKHPSMPLCHNGADCKTEGCKFTHLQTPCKFNPCMNRICPYKHAEGQRGNIGDKVWTPKSGTHVSERKFVQDESAPEELIKPDQPATEAPTETQNMETTA
ncbi:hypothetical protein N7532_008847 [Penicillium argentinense]|uniref:Nab2-like CCCH zinc finger domain-containing protein n=1 Tax=Penicillium argentinense TaxID=1131581 RepID=A0A9W9K221_9EURO|nr:uncharacterized protein N7532_008847 [Penicillium argentinense]KAJ5090163.1 hypothetical protein N7532_008847 [Penicillium argentinense]